MPRGAETLGIDMITEAQSEQLTCRKIQHSLAGWLRMGSQTSIILPNVFVGGSNWESDMVEVKKSGLWYEYEIKLSVADYRADFEKKQFGYMHNSLRKHEAYASDQPIMLGTRRLIPKPKQFYFVVPAGLLDAVKVPSHCGILEFTDPVKSRSWGISVKRYPPTLKPPTKLSPEWIFNLAVKASGRIRYQA